MNWEAIGVVAEVVGALEDDEIVDLHVLESDRNAHAAKTRSDDDDFMIETQ